MCFLSTSERFSELRVLRWFDRIDSAIAGEDVGPIRAAIDLTNYCTHNCPWCEPLQYRKETIADRSGSLGSAIALDVLGDLKGMDCKTIFFSGGGEPTVHPNFGPILKYAVELGMRTAVNTHGGLMHKWIPELLLADDIRISLDASNPKEHAIMHGSKEGEFLQVHANIATLAEARGKMTSPGIGLAYIIAECNDQPESLQRVYDFACDAGIDFIHFKPLSESGERKMASHAPMAALAWCEENLKGPVAVYGVGKRKTAVFEQREFKSCYSALTHAVIGANGDVQACCDERGIVFGNVNQQSFKSIWFGAKHREMAAAIVPALCQRCLQSGYNRSVEKFILNNEAVPELV